jgi:hypothetical protein
MTEEYLLQFIEPMLLILVPVLYIVGVLLKKSKVKDERIPLILGISGIVISSAGVLASSPIENFQDVMGAIFMAVTQGILTAGVSVYANQIKKQHAKRCVNTEKGCEREHVLR